MILLLRESASRDAQMQLQQAKIRTPQHRNQPAVAGAIGKPTPRIAYIQLVLSEVGKLRKYSKVGHFESCAMEERRPMAKTYNIVDQD